MLILIATAHRRTSAASPSFVARPAAAPKPRPRRRCSPAPLRDRAALLLAPVSPSRSRQCHAGAPAGAPARPSRALQAPPAVRTPAFAALATHRTPCGAAAATPQLGADTPPPAAPPQQQQQQAGADGVLLLPARLDGGHGGLHDLHGQGQARERGPDQVRLQQRHLVGVRAPLRPGARLRLGQRGPLRCRAPPQRGQTLGLLLARSLGAGPRRARLAAVPLAQPAPRQPAGQPASQPPCASPRTTTHPCPAPLPGRFHVDDMSSAHVYLRLPDGVTIDSIPAGPLEDCAQLVKQNSIQGARR
jgi:hypothetical protein